MYIVIPNHRFRAKHIEHIQSETPAKYSIWYSTRTLINNTLIKVNNQQ